MPLSSGVKQLEKDLLDAYNSPSEDKTAEIQARKVADAIHKYVKSGTPTTLITTQPGAVVGATTQGKVSGSGTGGFDGPAPKMGLSAAKPILEKELLSLWTSPNADRTAKVQAEKIAGAIHSYFSQATIKTKDETAGPLPAPPPVGPVAGSISGSGGIDSDSSGKGYDQAKKDLEKELSSIWKERASDSAKSAKERAQKITEAIHSFCKEGKVSTSGTFTAVATVDPVSTSGSYVAGIGSSSSGSVE